MKVALISHSFLPHMTGGIANYTFTLAEELTKKGIEVTVFCGGKVRNELPHNFKLVRLPMLNFPPRALWFQLQNFNFFKKELKKFDIIHGQMTATTFYSIIKEEINKPWVVTFHDHPTRGLKSILNSPKGTKNIGDLIFNILEYPLYKKLCDIDIKKADNIIAVGSSLVDDLVKYSSLSKKKVKVINNGVNLEKINKICKKIGSPKNKKVKLLFFGRLFYGKGVTFLIEAMKGVTLKEKNIELNIYGEGPLRKLLLDKIKQLKLGNYIKLHNFVSNEEIIKNICNSDIIVLPSLYESFPFAFLESMACGKPLIAFDYPFAREIIHGENGVLVPARDTKELKSTILKLILKKDLRNKIGKRAKEEIKKYSWDKLADKYIQFYKEIISQTGKND